MKKPCFDFSSRTLRLGGYSALLSVIVLAILVVFNLVVRALPVSYTQYDTSSQQLFTLSEQTKELVSSLESEVEVIHIVQGGTEDETIEGVLARYSSLGKNLKVSSRDPVIHPTYVSQYTDQTVSNNSILVICGDRSRYIPYTSIYVTDYSQYFYTGSTTTTFELESELTSAIQYVSTGRETSVYALTGHGERDIPSVIASTISKQNMSTSSLDLLSYGGVPADADCVVIYSPQRDISENERDMLLGYIDEGGKVLVATDAGTDDMPNLGKVLSEFGLSTNGGIIVEGDSSMSLSSYPYYLIPSLESHAITSPLKDEGYRVIIPIAQPITVTDTDGVSVTRLITTSSSSYNKLLGYESESLNYSESDEKGPFTVAAAAEKELEENTSRLVWFSSSMGFEDDVNVTFSGTNGDLFINSVGWLCEEEDAISIHPKSLTEPSLTVTAAQAAVGKALVVFIIPVSFIAAGILVRIRRRGK